MRGKLIGNVEVLDKVKEIILLPYGDSMTTDMVAEYYEVNDETIKKLVQRNREELAANGLVKLTEDSLRDFKSICQMKSRAKEILILSRRAVLNVGMLLQESPIAKEIRIKLLDMTEDKETINKIVYEIDEEKQLMLNVIMAKDEIESMMALNKWKRYRDDKSNAIKEEMDIAVEKVVNLTKSDATWGLRECCANIGVTQKRFTNYLIYSNYMYRQHKPSDEVGKSTGRLKGVSQYTQEPTRYFVDINQIDRLGNPRTQTVFSVDGVEYFRTKINDINYSK